jgi:hypothetical protein
MGADKFKQEGKRKKLDALNEVTLGEIIQGPHCCFDLCAGGETITTTCPNDLRHSFGASLNKVCGAGCPAQYQEYGQE